MESSQNGNMSAAVVFLPEGSEHFGSHDRIPRHCRFEGDCWCTPNYGEKKPWGCRWWTLWIANIEEAVQQKAELKVYFFEGKKNQGKVQMFATAGKEHKDREAIYRKRRTSKSPWSFRMQSRLA